VIDPEGPGADMPAVVERCPMPREQRVFYTMGMLYAMGMVTDRWPLAKLWPRVWGEIGMEIAWDMGDAQLAAMGRMRPLGATYVGGDSWRSHGGVRASLLVCHCGAAVRFYDHEEGGVYIEPFLIEHRSHAQPADTT